MKYLPIISFLALASCATDYHPQSFTGGYSEFKVAPDTATVTFNGNGFTSGERAAQMAILRCADLTLQSGYRYLRLRAHQAVSQIRTSLHRVLRQRMSMDTETTLRRILSSLRRSRND